MDIKEKIAVIEEMMDLDEGTLTVDTALKDLEEWDSITRLSILIYFEEEQGKKLSGEEIKAFITVKDITNLME